MKRNHLHPGFIMKLVPVLAAVAAFLLSAASAHAQSQPQISYIFPAGGQRGMTVEVKARGRFLVGATGVHVSGKGISGKIVSADQPAADKKQPRRLDVAANPDQAVVQLDVAADAEVGEHDFRVVTPGGVSNRFRFFVSQYPEVNEVEPNSTLEQAQDLPGIPVVANGQIQQGDRDIFRFKAKAGQLLVLDLQAQRILPYIADGVPGWFKATLTLYDAQGREVAFVDNFRHHPDPTMFYKVPTDGEYRAEVRDSLYRGRDEFVYRLTIGEVPLLTHVFPLGGQRGTKTAVKLAGVNFPQKELTLDLTAAEPATRQLVQVTTPSGLVSNSVPFAVDDLPEVMASKSGDSIAHAQQLTPPIIVNGKIAKPGDADYFVFTVKAKQTLVMQVYARRLDSPLDSILTLYNAKGNVLVENDDTIDKSEGLVTHHADSYISYTFPAAGDYILKITDTEGRGGDEYAYRLVVAPPQPDFLLRLRPDRSRVPEGGTTFFDVLAFRRDGFEGPIKLQVQNLPPGFTGPSEVMAEKSSDARLTISAAPDAEKGLVLPKVFGTARIGDKDVVRQALPSEDLMQAFYYMHNVPTRELLLSVIEKGPFTFTLDMPPGQTLRIPRLGRAELAVKVTFKEGIKPGVITLRPDRIPKEWQIEVPPINIGETQTTITISTYGNKAVFAGQRGTLIVTASMKVGNSTVYGYVPAIPYEIY